jgi:hypothetical protein
MRLYKVGNIPAKGDTKPRAWCLAAPCVSEFGHQRLIGNYFSGRSAKHIVELDFFDRIRNRAGAPNTFSRFLFLSGTELYRNRFSGGGYFAFRAFASGRFGVWGFNFRHRISA